MLGKIAAMLGISSFALSENHDAERTTADCGETFKFPVTREEALKKRKARKSKKAQKRARRANRGRR